MPTPCQSVSYHLPRPWRTRCCCCHPQLFLVVNKSCFFRLSPPTFFQFPFSETTPAVCPAINVQQLQDTILAPSLMCSLTIPHLTTLHRLPLPSCRFRSLDSLSLARAAREERVARVARRRRQKRRRSRGLPRPVFSSPSDVSTDSSSRGCTPTSAWVPHLPSTRPRSSST